METFWVFLRIILKHQITQNSYHVIQKDSVVSSDTELLKNTISESMTKANLYNSALKHSVLNL